ncbi:hypothetical protein MEPL4_7c00380 [Melissococcus plutonius]|nr:hypothetical protein MEPL_178p001360 [Melissococcus plutonius S1]KMT23573.1 hypothetical protein MEPL2_5c00900 [Melissococcus plutonius]KMT23623.1 hypothetical protein MEPL3_9c00140 [Melissococcus plutonius]KMT24260.1 hypothetical protein MEPL1_10c00060 [Melissococcus plutonius]KMT28087.1 hypothetical protein MEPL4_7c00380 [Melissococcus plutonius]
MIRVIFLKKICLGNIWVKMLASVVILFSLMGTSAAYAAYWTVSQEKVAAGGAWSTFGSPNTKQSSSNQASFNGDALPNSFGYNVWLINSNAGRRSDTVGLYKNSTSYAGNNSGLAGYSYYADVRSKSYEPNDSVVTLHFSANRK